MNAITEIKKFFLSLWALYQNHSYQKHDLTFTNLAIFFSRKGEISSSSLFSVLVFIFSYYNEASVVYEDIIWTDLF